MEQTAKVIEIPQNDIERQALALPEKARYGRLTVVSTEERNKWGYIMARCVCDCGNERLVSLCDLKRGHTSSCGCYRSEKMRVDSTTHGLSKTPTHNSWRGMMARCNNPKHQYYRLYGERGITVCQRWHSFENFLADMGMKPKGASIDRINNLGNYEPENCRWANNIEQARNVSSNRILTYKGKSQSVAAWADDLGVKAVTLNMRLFRGWSVTKTLERPIK